MEVLASLAEGFSTSLTLVNIFACFMGVLMGTLTGILPGLGPSAAMALLLPFSFGLSPTTSLIMLAGIYYG
ncbi:MAG: tripartite tricarboxylate transporter permease, partial [Desulfitobacterium hafniense]|nr:tripartite tricarboxylate transporter permease [Desulfitobacterium hafniense]